MKFNNILLISRDEFGIKDITDALREHEVLITDNADEAARICSKHNIHLVIVEEEFPGVNGCRLFVELRKKIPWVSGLLLTAKANETLLRRAFDIGFSGLLDKPIDSVKFLNRIYQITESISLQEENTRLRTLLPLYKISEKFLASTNEQEVFEGLVDIVYKETNASRISVMWYHEEDQSLRIVASRGLKQDVVDSIRLKPGDQVAGWVFQKGRPVVLNRNTQEDSIFASLLQRGDITAAVSFPISMQGEILGVLNISQSEGGSEFSEADIEQLGVISSQAAMSLAGVRFRNLLQEKTRVKTLFEQYVSPEVAELLISKGSDLVGLGEVSKVTIFFADIRESTTLVQRLDLKELRSFLNDFFQIFTEIIFEYHGTVDKFMGDAVLAIFGAPVPLENPNLSAVQTAVTIRKRFEELRQEWIARREDFSIVDIAIGITCGEVFLGNVGSSQRFDYTVLGTHVNIAQRIAAASPSGHIHITREVKEDVNPSFEAVKVGSMRLRGVEKLISVFSLSEEDD